MGAAKYKNTNPSVSPFLGIGEGKNRAAKAAAALAQEASKRETLMAENMAAIAGANVAAQKAAADAAVIAAKAAADTSAAKSAVSITNADSGINLYLIIGGIIVALMVGLYFIIKARKK